MACQDTIGSWENSDEAVHIGLILESPSGETSSEDEELIKIDTGFSGDVLIPHELYIDLKCNMHELLPTISQMANGTLLNTMRARGIIRIPQLDTSYEVTIFCFSDPSHTSDEILLGFEFIKKFRILFDGLNSKTCILKS